MRAVGYRTARICPWVLGPAGRTGRHDGWGPGGGGFGTTSPAMAWRCGRDTFWLRGCRLPGLRGHRRWRHTVLAARNSGAPNQLPILLGHDNRHYEFCLCPISCRYSLVTIIAVMDFICERSAMPVVAMGEGAQRSCIRQCAC